MPAAVAGSHAHFTRAECKDVLAPGDVVGKLTPAAAEHLGLPAGLLVAQGDSSNCNIHLCDMMMLSETLSPPLKMPPGGADAFIGMVGLGVLNDGGESSLHDALKHPIILTGRFLSCIVATKSWLS